MADDVDPESKTEDPTPRRREEARKQGQLPFSSELVGSVVLLAGVIGLNYFGRELGQTLLAVFREDLPQLFRPEFTPNHVQELFVRIFVKVVAALAPLLGLMLTGGVVANIVQVGLQFSPEKLEFKIDRLDPIGGLGRLFSPAALVKGLLGLLKIAALIGVSYFVIGGRFGTIFGVGRGRPADVAGSAWELVMRLALTLTAAVVLIALIDYVYQRRRFERGLRMTKQEIKDEQKQEEGDPQIKQRIRQIARERARRKMLSEVPKATVILTNPTHYAVALRYTQGRDETPVLVAKGAGVFAKAIAKLAREKNVPVVERPELARLLYGSVKEGQAIPGQLYRAVAEVIAFVYRMRGIGA